MKKSKMEQAIYFIQGNSSRLFNAYIHFLKQDELQKNNSRFILSGCAMINPNPSITEAEKLENKLNLLNRDERIPQSNIMLNKEGLERLGCFLEAKQTIERLDIKKPKIYMPIEPMHEQSYKTLFSRVTGIENIETIPVPHNSPKRLQVLTEILTSKAINSDTKDMNQEELIKYIQKFKYYNGKKTYDTKGLYSILWRLQELKENN